MDVPSETEFKELEAKFDALCRYLKIIPIDCKSHSEFEISILKAIKNCSVIMSYNCPECGGSFNEFGITFEKMEG